MTPGSVAESMEIVPGLRLTGNQTTPGVSVVPQFDWVALRGVSLWLMK